VKPCPSRTVAAIGFRPIKGDTMYKSLIEADFLLAVTLAFATVLIVAGVIARAIRWFATAHNNKPNAHQSSAESI
jgi:hypothetical protein